MKKLIILALVALAGYSAQAQAKMKKSPAQKSTTVATYEVDNNATSVLWTGKKVGGKHFGKIKVAQGSLTATGNQITNGSITIDMNSMTCDDIADAEYNGKLIGHLKNEDFFNTASHPEAKLDITKVTYKGKMAVVSGNLTIKGISQPISFNARIGNSGNQITANGKLVFDRTKYDIKYGSTLFGAAADKAIENNVSLDIVLVANKKG
ncbi:MAG: YceI family protein [Chitinophagales bacterium]|nr:YceI family protein [Chitinophagales bacterium]